MKHTRFMFTVFQYAGDKPLALPLLYTATPEHKEDLYDKHEAFLDTGAIVSSVEEVQFEALDHDPR